LPITNRHAEPVAYLFAVRTEDHALVHKLLKRLRVLGVPQIEKHLMPESRVQQMEHRVLGPANVQVHRHPILVELGTERLLAVLRIEETEVIPARPGPLGHGVRLARVPPTILLEVPPILGPGEASRRIIAG
jgi:hypothetical protein